MKKTFLTFIVSIFALISNVSYAQGIPTIDAAAIAKYLEQIQQMKTQIENQVSQIVELKNQVTALTSQENLGNLLKDTVQDAIPAEWKEIYDLANVDLNKIKDFKNLDPEAGLKLLVKVQAETEKAFDDIQKGQDTIQQLMAEINNSPNIKASQDLQNRLAIQNASIANVQLKLDQMDRLYQLEKEVLHQKKVNKTNCELDAWAKNLSGRTCQ